MDPPSVSHWLWAGVGQAQLPWWGASRRLRAVFWRRGQPWALSSQHAQQLPQMGPVKGSGRASQHLPQKAADELFTKLKMPVPLTQQPLFEEFCLWIHSHMGNDVFTQMAMAVIAEAWRTPERSLQGDILDGTVEYTAATNKTKSLRRLFMCWYGIVSKR